MAHIEIGDTEFTLSNVRLVIKPEILVSYKKRWFLHKKKVRTPILFVTFTANVKGVDIETGGVYVDPNGIKYVGVGGEKIQNMNFYMDMFELPRNLALAYLAFFEGQKNPNPHNP